MKACFRFWGIKYLVVIAGVVGAFFIPGGSFGSIWMYFGMIGAFVFIFVQLILIVDFAHSWAENWVSKYEQTESRKWLVVNLEFYNNEKVLIVANMIVIYIFLCRYAALLIAMLLLYGLAITGYIFLFAKFTKVYI